MKRRESLLLSIVISIVLMAGWAYSQTYIVDNLGDVDDGNPYTQGDGKNTLRKCIRLANLTGPDEINFSVYGTISPSSSLPPITDDGTVIDASSQWNGTWPDGQPGITLDGSGAGNAEGLAIVNADNCHIRGLFITGFSYDGLVMRSEAQFNTIGGTGVGYRNVISGNAERGVAIHDFGANSNIVIGNYIGTDVDGIAALGNLAAGVGIYGSAQSNIIGGTTVGERNIISGNNCGVDINGSGTTDNEVLGNYIGLDISGTSGLGNSSTGIQIWGGAQLNIVGGSAGGSGNVISGNYGGISIGGTGTDENIVSGNLIGTDVSGTTGIGNGLHHNAILINNGAQNNVIGGSGENDGNVVSGNHFGIRISDLGTDGNTVIGNLIGTDISGTVVVDGLWVTGKQQGGVLLHAGAKNNVIGGANTGERNVISGNDTGVEIRDSGTMGNEVIGNLIGVDATGTVGLGNNCNGINIYGGAQNNIIGGMSAGEGNIIAAANENGLLIWDEETKYNEILGNYIGTDITGTVYFGNTGDGVYIHSGAQSNNIGSNLIAFSSSDGIEVNGMDTDYNKISENAIYNNTELGIHLVDGGNDEIPAPTIISYQLVGNTLTVSGDGAGADATVEIFEADSYESGEGMTYLGSLTADGGGDFSGDLDVTDKGLEDGDPIVATTIRTDNNTSEFSSIPVVWTLANSPYIIDEHIEVGPDEILTIEPGVQVRFNGPYRLDVYGTLLAIGTESDRILFTSNQPDPQPGDWHSINFIGSDESIVQFCTIEYGSDSEIGYMYQGALTFDHSSPEITDNLIINNGKWGIICHDNSNPLISRNTISFNSWDGIKVHNSSSPQIINNEISHNGTSGIHFNSGGNPSIVGNVIFNNSSYGLLCYAQGFSDNVTNNTVYGNGDGGISLSSDSEMYVRNTIVRNNNNMDMNIEDPLTFHIAFSDIQGGWEGEGNIDLDPYFFDPSNGDFHLQLGSPCIDAGDPNTDYNDLDGTRNDMGAYGGPSGESYTYEDAPPTVENVVVEPFSVHQGNDVTITCYVWDAFSSVYSVQAEIESPDEFVVIILDLYDDGLHGDGDAGDSIYGNSWTTPSEGQELSYFVDIIASDDQAHTSYYNNVGEFYVEERIFASALLTGSYLRVRDQDPINPDANPSAYQITGTAITVEAWVYPLFFEGSEHVIVTRPLYPSEDPWETYGLRLVENGGMYKPVFRVSSGDPGSRVEAMSPDPLPTFQWTHLAGTYDGEYVRLYVNGVFKTEVPTSISIGDGGYGLYMGEWYGPFYSAIDDVRLWNITRTETEIQNAMNDELTSYGPELAGYWRMEETDIINYVYVTVDQTNNNNDLQILGNVQFIPFHPFGIFDIPQISVDPSFLDFGVVEQMEVATRSLAITNPSTEPLIGFIDAEGTGLGPIKSGFFVEPEVSEDVNVSVHVLDAGSLSGDITVHSNAEGPYPVVGMSLQAVPPHPVDANNITMWVQRDGRFARNPFEGGNGFEWPKESGKSAIYTAGLWIGATVASEVRTATAGYSSEFAPGPIINGIPADPNDTKYRVYKIQAGDNGSNPDYAEWPGDLGAPVNGDGSPKIFGDQTLFSVYNDFDEGRHSQFETLPLGAEVQQTAFAFNQTIGALSNAVFLRFKIINKSNTTWENAYVVIWNDPDLGDSNDDLAGVDVSRDLGFVYNLNETDDIYGSPPPAVGYDILKGALSEKPIQVFSYYTAGVDYPYNDPRNGDEAYNFMKGLLRDGSQYIDPTTGQPTLFALNGDPVTGSGWVDSDLDDRRFLISTGPFDLGPGQSKELIAAIIVGQGSDRLNSITALRAASDEIQVKYDNGEILDGFLRVIAVEPSQNALSVEKLANIAATFNMDLDLSTVNGNTVLIYGGSSGQHNGTINYTNNVITFDPDDDFVAGEEVVVVLTSGITSTDGIQLTGGYSWHFYVDVPVSGLSYETQAAWTSSNLGATWRLKWSDFDRDGDLDLACANTHPDDFASTPVTVYRNQNGSLESDPFWTAPAGSKASDLKWAYINNDGYPDLVCSGPVVYFNNNGVISDAPTQVSQTPFYFGPIAVADIDGDGDFDIASADQNNIYLFVNETGTFSGLPVWQVSTANRPVGFDFGDLEGDGDPDLAVNYRGLHRVEVYRTLNAALETSPYWSSYEFNGDGWDVRWGDLNGDGNLDLIAASWDNGIDVYIHTGSILPDTPTYALSSSPVRIDLGDVNGDGDLDIGASGDTAPYGEVIYLNVNGIFNEENIFPIQSPAGNSGTLAFGDVDLDGDLDVVVGGGRDYGDVNSLQINVAGFDPEQIIYVDVNNTTGVEDGSQANPYNTIDEGMNAAQSGDIVMVMQGTYEEEAGLKTDVVLMGEGPNITTIWGNAFAEDVTGAKIIGFKIEDDNTAGIHFYNSQVEVRNCVVLNQPHNGIHCSNTELTAINNVFINNGHNGILFIDGSTGTLFNNIIVCNNNRGINGSGAESLTINYNNVWGNGGGNYSGNASPGPNDISESPLFVNLDNDFHLQIGSPCIDAGDPDPVYNDPDGSCNDMGAYGGPSGESYTYEDGPPVVENVNVLPLSTQPGFDVTITCHVWDVVSSVSSVEAEIEAPDENIVETIVLFDDGSHGDGEAGDNIYGNLWTTPLGSEGTTYFVDIIASDDQAHITHYNNASEFYALQKLDANNISMWMQRNGQFARRPYPRGPGFEWPKGTTKTAIYASGIWIGAEVGGEVRTAVASYNSEFSPGPVINGGIPADPNDMRYRVYKIQTGDDNSNPDYAEWPSDLGAPVNADGTPMILGDQTLFAVYNDLDEGRHYWGTQPLGVEVQQTTFAFNQSGPLEDAVFLRFKVVNRSNDTWEDTYVSLWSDPDLGYHSDDLVGVDVDRNIGYVYNGDDDDEANPYNPGYGSTPPAVGYDILKGAFFTKPIQAFAYYTAGADYPYRDPNNGVEAYNFMQGLLQDGSQYIDPKSGLPTRYALNGDPVTSTRWIDSSPGDRRFLFSTGPFDLEPGQSKELIAAIIVGQGSDRLNSITELRSASDDIQVLFDGGQIFGGAVENITTIDLEPSETDTLDDMNNSGAQLEVTAGADSVTVEMASYIDAPPGADDISGPAITGVGKYIDVQVLGDVEWPVEIRIYYTANDLAQAGVFSEDDLLGLYYWRGASSEWRLYSESGDDDQERGPSTTEVNTENVTIEGVDYEGYVWATAYHLTPMRIVSAVTDQPVEAIEALITIVENLDLHHGTENSLVSKLNNAIKSLQKEHHNAAVNQLNAFINHVEAQSGKKISEEDAENLILYAQSIIDLIQGGLGKKADDLDQETANVDVPKEFALHQNYPNPFNPETKIRYELPEAGRVTLVVYNMMGQEVRRLVDADQSAGYYVVVWDGRGNDSNRLGSGVYFIHFRARDYRNICKLILVQ